LKFLIQIVLLALAIVGGVALERYALSSPKDHHQALNSEATMMVEKTSTITPESRAVNAAELQDDQPVPTDFVSAINEAERLKTHLREKRKLYEQWIDEDPAVALAYALGSEGHLHLKHEVIHQAFERLTEKDLDLALGAFASLKTHRQRMEAADAMARHVNLTKRFELADFFSKEMPNAPIEAFYRRWAETAPAETKLLEYAEANGREALNAVAEGWVVRNPSDALSRATALDKRLGTTTMEIVLGATAALDPSFATGWFHKLKPGPRRNDVAKEIAHHLAQDDIDAARGWVEHLDPSAKRGALEELTSEWARQDPHSAGEFALSLSDPDVRRKAVSEVAHRLAEADLGTALDWVNELEGDNALAAMRGMVSTVAETNPQAAADLVSQLGPSEAFNDMAGDLASHWSKFDPPAAANWVATLPAESEAQHHAIGRVVDHWVQLDPAGASEWIQDLPQGDLQNEMLHHVFEQWQAHDLHGAEAGFNAATLSNEQRTELQELFKPTN
jgi:hypothetical protein